MESKETPHPQPNAASKPVEKAKAATLPEGMFKNISISIVGGGKGNTAKNVNIQNLIGSRTSTTSSTSSQSSKTAPSSTQSSSSSFTGGPNISLKRQGSPSKSQPFDTKRFKSSSIVITSSRKDSPTITLDELINKADDDDEEEAPKENHAYDYNNCTHGDPLSYMCVDCTYMRWKTGYDYVKTRKEKPKKTVVENIQEVEEAVVEDVSNKSDNDSKTNSENASTEVPKDTSNKAADILKNVNR